MNSIHWKMVFNIHIYYMLNYHDNVFGLDDLKLGTFEDTCLLVVV